MEKVREKTTFLIVFYLKGQEICLVDVVELHVDEGVRGGDEEGQGVVQRLHITCTSCNINHLLYIFPNYFSDDFT